MTLACRVYGCTHTHFSVQLEKSNLDEHTTAKGKQEVEEAIWQSRPLCGQGGSTVHALIHVPCSPPSAPFLPEECYKSAGTPGCLLASAAGKEPRSAGWRGRAPAVVPVSEPYARSSGLPPWWSGKAENRLYHTQAIYCLPTKAILSSPFILSGFRYTCSNAALAKATGTFPRKVLVRKKYKQTYFWTVLKMQNTFSGSNYLVALEKSLVFSLMVQMFHIPLIK